ncbi:MAG: M3 family oligoendopeptidase [Spirochaetales bacterium]|nr:M3 family oligoendopeptidase [Candidatus Physcosoma equi]
MNNEKLPKWDRESIYPSVNSEEFRADIQKVYVLSDELKRVSSDPSSSILSILQAYDAAAAVVSNVGSYAYTSFSVDTTNPAVLTAMGNAEKAETAFSDAVTVMTFHLSKRTAEFDAPELKDYALFLKEIKVSSEHMMSLEEEALANEMLQVSASAWGRLQESVTSGIKDGDKTLTQLRGLAMSPDRAVRKDAYERELKILKANETAIAAALNGVKGTALLLEKRRGWSDPIDRSISTARISRKTLDALIGALEDARPMFRDYLKTKAKLLGLERLEWYDMFAPVGEADMSFTFEDAKKLVQSSYAKFSPAVGDFIQNAFDNHWVDPEAHEGKIGGAYDISFPLKGESRVMMNWEGTYDSVSTLAHELGHAYHDSVVKDYPMSQASYPMTLAETASIFGETVIFQEVLKTATKEQQLPIIEAFVQGACQVCVDILSRFYFERSAFAARKAGEVTAEDFSKMMLQAQEDTYGDGLGLKHQYMWAVKGHYYSEGFSFYNYPYAFGQLFALGLYASKDTTEDFPKHYREVLAMTGRYEAKEVAAAAGCDIESKEFWMKGIAYIGTYVEKMKEWL